MGNCWSPGDDRDHTIYRYTDQIYKVVQWYRPIIRGARSGPGEKAAQKSYSYKLAASISRARRVILEKALCNDWEWFCTFTISPEKLPDRFDLSSWWKSFSQWLRDKRKAGLVIRYLLVPERHEDGAWHCHGLISGIPESELIRFSVMDKQGYRTSRGHRLPRDLVNSSFLNWPAYAEKFGFCSLDRIKDPVSCGFYVTKYISKDTSRMVSAVGLKTYYTSTNLNVATHHVDYFGRDPLIEQILVNKYEFCRTGMTHSKSGFDWTFGLDLLGDHGISPLVFSDPADPEMLPAAFLEAEAYAACDQLDFYSLI